MTAIYTVAAHTVSDTGADDSPTSGAGPHLHTVAITGTVCDPSIEFTCHGDRSAPCHRYPDCECELWDDNHEHPSVPHEKCLLQTWFDDGDVDPPPEELSNVALEPGMSGPICTSFHEDYIAWRFVDRRPHP